MLIQCQFSTGALYNISFYLLSSGCITNLCSYKNLRFCLLNTLLIILKKNTLNSFKIMSKFAKQK